MDERFGELLLTFKTPSRENILASLNRLLKPQWPMRRVGGVYERFLKNNALSPAISRKGLESLALPVLEGLYREVLCRALIGKSEEGPSGKKGLSMPSGRIDALLSLFLLAEEMSEFLPSLLVREDIALLGQREAPAMHGYYYDGSLTRPQMINFLKGQGCRTDFLAENEHSLVGNAISELALQQAYLACRRLGSALAGSSPGAFLPWRALLQTLSSEERRRFPRLARLNAIREAFEAGGEVFDVFPVLTEPLTPASFPEQLSAMQLFLGSPVISEIAVRYVQARPLRLMLLVEGETEKRLLPLFAQVLGCDFSALGIDVLPAGGKNHVIRLYREYAEYLAVPLCVVLDDDAREVAFELESSLRPTDRVFCFTEGEFEDTYDVDILLETVNRCYQPFPELTAQDLNEAVRLSGERGRVPALRLLWQTHGFGAFDKVAFANQYAESVQRRLDSGMDASPPPPICALLRLLLDVRHQPGSGL